MVIYILSKYIVYTGVKMTTEIAWQNLSDEEKKRQLFLNQKETLDLFLARGAITQAQYDKSYGDLKIKMGFEKEQI